MGSTLVCWLALSLLLKHKCRALALDLPNQRSLHTQPTPKGGGIVIVGVIILTSVSLMWYLSGMDGIFVALGISALGFGAIGFVDDYRKVAKKNSRGLPGRKKLIYQFLILCCASVGLWAAQEGYLPIEPTEFDTTLTFPFVGVKFFNPDLGMLYIPFAFLVIMGTSHGMNLTDGLDGLAIGPTVVSSVTFLILAYIAGSVLTFNSGGQWVEFNLAQYLGIVYIEGASELAVFCGAIAGAGIGFLWFNTFPATVFMGDVGSLALGGALGTVAVLTKNEFLSAIIHGVFLMETLSVITQVASFKMTGKRVFRMAPIHHHFELKGWAEPKIIVRFWIISIILALVALTSLKLR